MSLTVTDTSPPLSMPTTARIARAEARIAENSATITRLEREIAQRVADEGDLLPEARATIAALHQENADVAAGLTILRERLAAEQAAAAEVAAAAEQERRRERARVRIAAAEKVDAAMAALGAAYAAYKSESRDAPTRVHQRAAIALRGALHAAAPALALDLELARPQGPFRGVEFAHGERVLAPAGTLNAEESR